MGNAFTAVADDEMVLFYNPAGLTLINAYAPIGSSNGASVDTPDQEPAPEPVQEGESAEESTPSAALIGGSDSSEDNQYLVELLSLQLAFNENIGTLSLPDFQFKSALTGWGDDPLAFLGDSVGNRYYAEIDLSGASYLSTNWGYSLFGNAIIDISIHNPIVPYLQIKAILQTGYVAGFAFSNGDLDLGISFKDISREGMNRELRFSDEIVINMINENTATAANADGTTTSSTASEATSFNDLVVSASASGFDAGFTYHLDDRTQWALVAQNIGGLDFGELGALPTLVNFGWALKPDKKAGGIMMTYAVDYRDVLNEEGLYGGTFQLRNLKIGAEMGLWPLDNGHYFFSFRLGRNGTYPTMGFTLNPNWIGLYLLPKIEYAQWSEELGRVAGEKQDRLQALRFSWVY